MLVGDVWRELLGNGLSHTSEALTSYLGRTEAGIEQVFRLFHLVQLIMILGWL